MIPGRFKILPHQYEALPKSMKFVLHVINWLVPQRSETTLYILASSFFATYLINPNFYEYVQGLTDGTVNGAILVPLFSLTVIVTIGTAFIKKPISGFRNFFAPLLVLLSTIFLTLEYIRIQSETGGFVSILFLGYHSLVLIIFLLFFDEFADLVSTTLLENRVAPLLKLILATVLTFIIFTLSYYFTDWHDISFALPISLTLTTWTILEQLGIKFRMWE